MSGHCSRQNVVEADGSVYPCDFYVLDAYRLGNLRTDSFADIERRREELGFIESSREVQPDCLACRWQPLCRGGCRRDREQPDGTLGRNYFCSAYKEFFAYAAPRLEELAGLVQRGRALKKEETGYADLICGHRHPAPGPSGVLRLPAGHLPQHRRAGR